MFWKNVRENVFLKEEQITEDKLKKIRALNEVAKERGESLSRMALEWVLSCPAITSVLIGASRPEQIRENAKCHSFAPFTDDEKALIDKIAIGE